MGNPDTQHVLSVVGVSFCGSTVLNLVLGAHPEIHGGGELLKLFMPQKHPRCSVCQYECVKWTPDALASIRKEGLYSQLADIFDQRVIVDSSKMIGHFEEVRPLNPDVRFVYVLMVKHPLRHAASYVNNKFVVDNKLLTDVDAGGLSEETQHQAVEYAQKRLRRIQRDYDDMRQRLDELAGGAEYTVLRYEDFVQAPIDRLSPILEQAGLEPDGAMLDHVNRIHHPIGGNRGPHYQLNKQLSTVRFVNYRKDFYGTSNGLVLDQKYRQTFTSEQIEQIAAMPHYEALCESLGYDPDPATV